MWNAKGTLVGSAPVSSREQGKSDDLLGENFAMNSSYFDQFGIQYETIFYVNFFIPLLR